MSDVLSDMSTGKLVDLCAKFKGQVASINAERDAALEKPLAVIQRIEAELLLRLAREEQTTFKGFNWMFGIKDTTNYNIADPAAWSKFVLETQDLSFFGKSVMKTAVEDYEKEHGRLPPGIGCSNKRTTFMKAVKK